MAYSENLLNVKTNYPFTHWVEDWYPIDPDNTGEIEYNDDFSPENCQEVQDIFDALIQNLIEIGENAAISEKEKAIESAIIKLNKKHENTYFIDTIAREALCDLFDEIGVAAGLNPEDYDDDIAGEWREW